MSSHLVHADCFILILLHPYVILDASYKWMFPSFHQPTQCIYSSLSILSLALSIYNKPEVHIGIFITINEAELLCGPWKIVPEIINSHEEKVKTASGASGHKRCLINGSSYYTSSFVRMYESYNGKPETAFSNKLFVQKGWNDIAIRM